MSSLTSTRPHAVEELRAARLAKREAETVEETAKAIITGILGDAEAGVVNGRTVVVRRQIERSEIDSRRLRVERPDVFDAYQRTTSYFRVDLPAHGFNPSR